MTLLRCLAIKVGRDVEFFKRLCYALRVIDRHAVIGSQPPLSPVELILTRLPARQERHDDDDESTRPVCLRKKEMGKGSPARARARARIFSAVRRHSHAFFRVAPSILIMG